MDMINMDTINKPKNGNKSVRIYTMKSKQDSKNKSAMKKRLYFVKRIIML